jgi:hypothetical protein
MFFNTINILKLSKQYSKVVSFPKLVHELGVITIKMPADSFWKFSK